MSRLRGSAGMRQSIEFDPPESDRDCPSVAIVIGDVAGTDSRWRLTLRTLDDRGRSAWLGEIETLAPVDTERSTRVVAVATCPGVRRWIVDAQLISSSAENPEAELTIVGTPGTATERAMVALDGELVGRRRVVRGGALVAPTGIVVLAAGETLVGWSAWQDGAGMTVQLGVGGDLLPVPTDGAIGGAPELRGARTITFGAVPAGGGGYQLEVAR